MAFEKKKSLSEGCSTNKLYRSMSIKVYRSMSNKLYRKLVHTNFIGVCPPNYIRGLSNKLYRRLTNEFSKTKIFCFENIFSYMAKCMCEGVSDDSRHGTGHVNIRVGMCILVLECVCVCHYMCT